MQKAYDHPVPDEDPYKILAVESGSGEKEIRSAYLKKIKEFPPDRSPEEFQRIRDAYEILRDPRRRATVQLRSIDPEAPLAALLDGQKKKREFLGPGPWLAVMAKK